MKSLDLSLLAELREFMDADVHILITEFEADTRERLIQIAQAIENHDAETLRQTAHSLKGGAATLGALSLSQQFRGLELRGRDASFSGIEQDFGNTQRSFEEAMVSLNKWLLQS
ncbi:Hpt domain-containing protein [Zhongshania borealis]|jgi:HPt (histidine-containing phosphotransfer) domain-containing protein|uniref:HPt domain-containing protein n=1 Tax=Zhongshania borealis TaxID=889488 RepID=A0ABP7W8T9_9GAMM